MGTIFSQELKRFQKNSKCVAGINLSVCIIPSRYPKFFWTIQIPKKTRYRDKNLGI